MRTLRLSRTSRPPGRLSLRTGPTAGLIWPRRNQPYPVSIARRSLFAYPRARQKTVAGRQNRNGRAGLQRCSHRHLAGRILSQKSKKANIAPQIRLEKPAVRRVRNPFRPFPLRLLQLPQAIAKTYGPVRNRTGVDGSPSSIGERSESFAGRSPDSCWR